MRIWDIFELQHDHRRLLYKTFHSATLVQQRSNYSMIYFEVPVWLSTRSLTCICIYISLVCWFTRKFTHKCFGPYSKSLPSFSKADHCKYSQSLSFLEHISLLTCLINKNDVLKVLRLMRVFPS